MKTKKLKRCVLYSEYLSSKLLLHERNAKGKLKPSKRKDGKIRCQSQRRSVLSRKQKLDDNMYLVLRSPYHQTCKTCTSHTFAPRLRPCLTRWSSHHDRAKSFFSVKLRNLCKHTKSGSHLRMLNLADIFVVMIVKF